MDHSSERSRTNKTKTKNKAMKTTKFIKVSTADRLPEKNEAFHTSDGSLDFKTENKCWYYAGWIASKPKYWLDEKPDHEEEMRELMKKLDTELNYQDKCREMTGGLYECWDDLKELLTKIKES